MKNASYPTVQLMQSETELAPVTFKKVPAGQAVFSPYEAQYDPVGHCQKIKIRSSARTK